jgi:hypothetical protein
LTAIPVDAVRVAAQRGDVIRAVETLYRELDAEIAARSPTCWNKGECCRFSGYGHRLYVTTLEVAYYLARGGEPVGNAAAAAVSHERSLPVLHANHVPSNSNDVCPHAYGGRCHARERRPMGCRIFYCDPAAQHWQGPLTEKYLGKLRNLHERFEVPYLYADWMRVLESLDPAPELSGGAPPVLREVGGVRSSRSRKNPPRSP